MKEMGEVRCFLLDMDGTINLGQSLLPGAKDFMHYLTQSGRDFLFLTNNSSKDAQHYAEKMTRLGIPCDEAHVLTSGDATAIYLKQQQTHPRVYLLGTPELADALQREGIILTTENPDFVVLGFDTTLTYNKLRQACKFIRAGISYVATHPDYNCPTEDGFIPDAGAMIELIRASTGKMPKVIGKPNAEIITCAFQRRPQYTPTQFAIVGDRVYTDIKTGKNAGIASILVLSGESTRKDQELNNVYANFVVDGVGDIYRELVVYDKKQQG